MFWTCSRSFSISTLISMAALTNADAEFVESGSFGQNRRHFPVHLLKDEVHALPASSFSFLRPAN